MKKVKKIFWMGTFILCISMLAAGCRDAEPDRENSSAAASTEEENLTHDENNTAAGRSDTGDTDGKDDSRPDDAGDMAKDVDDAVKDVGDAVKDAADGAGDAVDDVADGVGDAVDDVADGVGDAIDNLGGGSFDSYEEAKKYLLDKLKKDNAGASYEVREETDALTSYNSNDSGAVGYKFSVYETDGNEKIGIYYVDKNTGKIYRYMGKNSIEAY